MSKSVKKEILTSEYSSEQVLAVNTSSNWFIRISVHKALRGYSVLIYLYVVKLEKTRRVLFCNGNVWVRLTLLPSQRAVGARGQKAIPSLPSSYIFIKWSYKVYTQYPFISNVSFDLSACNQLVITSG